MLRDALSCYAWYTPPPNRACKAKVPKKARNSKRSREASQNLRSYKKHGEGWQRAKRMDEKSSKKPKQMWRKEARKPSTTLPFFGFDLGDPPAQGVGIDPCFWKATKEYLNQRGTKSRVFRVCFRTPFLPPFFPHFSPLFPLQALCILAPLLPSSPPPSSPLFRLPEKSDLGTPLI